MKRFPDCSTFSMPQRSEAWHEIRRDKLTASQAGSWLAEVPEVRATVAQIKADLDLSGIAYKASARRDELLALLPVDFYEPTLSQGALDARESAICKVLGAMSRCEMPDEWEVDPKGLPPRNPKLWAIWNGIRLEPEAADSFRLKTGLEFEMVGFCLHKSGVAGCSPDGLIVGENVGFEGKCPLPQTHIRYLRAGVLPDEYREQIHFSMAVTGAEAWWFQSYCPGLPAFRLRVERDEFTERMAAGIDSFAKELTVARLAMKSLWDSEFDKKEDENEQ